MWAFLVVGIVWAVGLVFSTVPSSAEAARLSGEKIKSTLAGAVLELDTPLGTKVPVRFSKDGLMSGDAGALGAYLGADRDRGRWWVAEDRLCMKWFKWFEAAVHCFSLQMEGDFIHWQEQGGRSGTATIAVRPKEDPAAPTVIASDGAAKKRQEAGHEVSRLGQISSPAAAIGSAGDKAAASPQKQIAPEAEHGEAAPTKRIAEAVVEKPAPRSEAGKEVQSRKPIAIPPLPVRSATRANSKPLPARRTFRVARVADDDFLNVRTGPSEYHMPIGAIAPDGRGINIVGPCHGLWCPIRYRDTSGWVNSYYLAPEGPQPAILVGSR